MNAYKFCFYHERISYHIAAVVYIFKLRSYVFCIASSKSLHIIAWRQHKCMRSYYYTLVSRLEVNIKLFSLFWTLWLCSHTHWNLHASIFFVYFSHFSHSSSISSWIVILCFCILPPPFGSSSEWVNEWMLESNQLKIWKQCGILLFCTLCVCEESNIPSRNPEKKSNVCILNNRTM